jgi:hypothetical protein
VDTGHQTGQRKFLRPSSESVQRALAGEAPVPYLGLDTAYALFAEAQGRSPALRVRAAEAIAAEMNRYPHLFAAEKDCDLYRWLEELGCYLQQTNGGSSSHLPFTEANNEAFENFPHTTDRPRDLLPVLAESVRYWRQWVPEDGLALSALLGG